jgi:hypothetical protein
MFLSFITQTEKNKNQMNTKWPEARFLLWAAHAWATGTESQKATQARRPRQDQNLNRTRRGTCSSNQRGFCRLRRVCTGTSGRQTKHRLRRLPVRISNHASRRQNSRGFRGTTRSRHRRSRAHMVPSNLAPSMVTRPVGGVDYRGND